MVQPKSCQPVNIGEQFDRYFLAVFKYFRYRGADADTANDLTSAVFERALTKLSTFDPAKGAFNTWLFTIAHHISINEWKTKARTKCIPLEQGINEPVKDPSPEDVLVYQERIDALVTAIQALDDREREIIALKFAGNLANRQIAGLVNISVSNVGVILFRAIQKMRLGLSLPEGQVCHE